MKWNEPSVCHKLWSILWPLVQVCSLTMECRHFRTNYFWHSPTDPNSSSLNWWSSRHGVETLYSCWVVLLTTSQYRSTHFFARPSVSQGPCWDVCIKSPRTRIFSAAPAEILDSNIFVIVDNTFACFALPLSAPQVNVVRDDVSSATSTCFVSAFHIGSMFCFFPAQFYVVHIHRQELSFSSIYKQAFSIWNFFPTVLQ